MQTLLFYRFSGQAEPVISKVLEYKYIWYRKWGNYKQGIFQPYLLACQLPQSHWKQVPVSVSVVEHVCDVATNNLRVHSSFSFFLANSTLTLFFSSR